MPSRKKQKQVDSGRLFSSEVCAFCGSNEENELLYGKYVAYEGISVHEYCLYFASGLTQGGEENEGIYGFLLPDIDEELQRGKKLFCSFCKKRGATTGCSEVKCKKSFHLNCGIKHGTLQQFFGSFSSYCKEHSPKQKSVNVSEDLLCHICCDKISQCDLHSCLYSPCCKRNWFHRICLQKYAQSAGLYFFKCPLCNDVNKFAKEMELHGIYIPKKDASWELEENAFQELLVKPECDAAVCLCINGRKYSASKKSVWTILPCCDCGYHARHKKCENIKLNEKSWICNECKALEEKIHENKVNQSVHVKATPVIKTEKQETEASTSRTESTVAITSLIDSSNILYQANSSFPSSESEKQIEGNKSTIKKKIDISSFFESAQYDTETDSFANESNENNSTSNLIAIRNVPAKDSLQKCSKNKISTVKKNSKKLKKDSSCCHQGQCIKKFFGLECGRYRV